VKIVYKHSLKIQ